MRTLDLRVRLEDGRYHAVGQEETDSLIYSVIAEGATWDELKTDVKEVLNAVYYDTSKPDRIFLHLEHKEQLLVS